MARYGYNWQVPFRVAVPGYQEYLQKWLHQMNALAANIQDLIKSEESLESLNFDHVMGYLLNRKVLVDAPYSRLSLYGLPKVSIITGATLTNTLNATNVLPGYLFIRAILPNGESRLLFDDGQGNLISYQSVMGNINYEAGTYKLNDKGTEYVSAATSFIVSFCPGTVNYPTLVDSTSIDSYTVSKAVVKTAGTSYKVGDLVEAGNATFSVTTVGTDGDVTAVTLDTAKSNTADVAGDVSATGGTGSGLVLTLTTTKESKGLMKCEGAIPGAAASLPEVAIYFTEFTDKVYVGYNTTDEVVLSKIFDTLKSY